jgi:hypothetical protein
MVHLVFAHADKFRSMKNLAVFVNYFFCETSCLGAFVTSFFGASLCHEDNYGTKKARSV